MIIFIKLFSKQKILYSTFDANIIVQL